MTNAMLFKFAGLQDTGQGFAPMYAWEHTPQTWLTRAQCVAEAARHGHRAVFDDDDTKHL